MSTATLEPVTSGSTLWTMAETARFLRVSEATVRLWMKSGKIPKDAVNRPGLKWLFNAEKIRALIEG